MQRRRRPRRRLPGGHPLGPPRRAERQLCDLDSCPGQGADCVVWSCWSPLGALGRGGWGLQWPVAGTSGHFSVHTKHSGRPEEAVRVDRACRRRNVVSDGLISANRCAVASAHFSSPLLRQPSGEMNRKDNAAHCCIVIVILERGREVMQNDQRLSVAAAAVRAGVKPATWRAYVARAHPRGNPAPPPDGREEVSGTPYWYAGTIDLWKDRRPGRGARTDLRAQLPTRLLKEGAPPRVSLRRNRRSDPLEVAETPASASAARAAPTAIETTA
jgi:hypothetical protein